MRVITASVPRKRKKPDEAKPPMFYATVRWKEAVRREMAAKKIKRKVVADAAGVTGEAITQLLGPEDGNVAAPSNTEHMPAINKVVGFAPPPICDPDDPLAEIKALLDAARDSLSPNTLEAIKMLLRR